MQSIIFYIFYVSLKFCPFLRCCCQGSRRCQELFWWRWPRSFKRQKAFETYGLQRNHLAPSSKIFKEFLVFSSHQRLLWQHIQHWDIFKGSWTGKTSQKALGADFPKPKMAFQDRKPFQPCLPIHAMLNFLKIYRTEWNFTGHVLRSCGFRKVWFRVFFHEIKCNGTGP